MILDRNLTRPANDGCGQELMMMAFDPTIQSAPNGGWTKSFRDRVEFVKQKLGVSYAEIADAMGFSNAFIYGLIKGKPSHRMNSKHCEQILRGLESLEVKAGIKKVSSLATQEDDLAALVNKIAKLGFSVELKPLR